ncbi:MAG: hypothetical protein QM770_22915 [Tepidisphaeraceae bacterium]
MPIPVIILVVAVFITLIVVGGIYAAKKERERIEALKALAQRLGFTFEQSDAGEWSRHPHFSTFTRGHSKRSYNTLRGTVSVQDGISFSVVAGDYTYKTEEGSGKDRRTVTHNLSYFIIRPAIAFTQQLQFRREGLFDKIAGAIGFEDIDFESNEFSKKYLVKCDDKKFAYDLFDPRMIQWLLDQPPPTSLISAMGEILVGLYGASGRWKPEQFELALNWTRDFLSRWPHHLVSRLTIPSMP